MSYLENGRAQESIVRQRAYSAPQIGITESLQSPGLVTPGPVSYGAAIADDLLRTLSLAGQAAQVGVQIQREQQAERARLERERAADFAARMKMQDEADKANQSEVLGMATRDANTIQARLVNELKTGRLAIDDTRDPEAIAADLIGSELPENASNIYATKMYDELIRPLTEAVVSARTAVQENERKSISTNLSNAVFGAKNVDEVNAAMAEASAKGVDPQAVLVNGVEAIAELGTPEAVSRARAFAEANVVDPKVRAALVSKADAIQKQSNAQAVDSVFGAYRIGIQTAEDTGMVTPLLEIRQNILTSPIYASNRAESDSLVSRIDKTISDMAEARQKAADRAAADQQFMSQVRPNLVKIASGSWWETGDVEVKVGGETRKATLAEQRRMAYEAAAANVDNVEGLAPEERSRLKLQVAFKQNYMPDEIPAKATANVQQMQAFGLPVAGADKVVVTPAMQETVALYQEGNKLSPSWAAGMFANDNDRAYMNSIVEYLGSNTNDLKGAISYANNVRTSGQVDVVAVDSATKSIIDDYDFVGGEIGAHIMREARLNMGAGVSAKKAVELAKELVKSRLVTINGYSTYVYDRNFNEQDQKALNRGVRAWFEHVAKNYGSRPENLGGISRDKPLTADDMRLRQDRNGMWVVLDARDGRGKIVATGDDLMLSAMTTKEVMDMQMLADSRAIRAEADAERARKDRRSVDISASSDTGSGTY